MAGRVSLLVAVESHGWLGVESHGWLAVESHGWLVVESHGWLVVESHGWLVVESQGQLGVQSHAWLYTAALAALMTAWQGREVLPSLMPALLTAVRCCVAHTSLCLMYVQLLYVYFQLQCVLCVVRGRPGGMHLPPADQRGQLQVPRQEPVSLAATCQAKARRSCSGLSHSA